jgi:hypothetical protein
MAMANLDMMLHTVVNQLLSELNIGMFIQFGDS